MNNERGGILSKLFIIPAGVVLMVGFFFLGYYVGKYQSKTGTQSEVALPLPDVSSNSSPQKEEFTFYKTLTDKDNKTVSIDLKPRPEANENRSEKKAVVAETPKDAAAQPLPKEKRTERKINKSASSPPAKEKAVKKPQLQTKKEPVVASLTNPKLRYTIQIAAYQEKGMAEEDVKRMKKRGYAAFIASSELPGKGKWFRVRIGSFSNKASAEKLEKEIHAKEGITPIVVIE